MIEINDNVYLGSLTIIIIAMFVLNDLKVYYEHRIPDEKYAVCLKSHHTTTTLCMSRCAIFNCYSLRE
jgi:hypothetical protein